MVIGKWQSGSRAFLRDVLENDVLSDPSRLESYSKGLFVFPDRLELHLGISCQCKCRMCWRWEKEWTQEQTGLYHSKTSDLLRENEITALIEEFQRNGGRLLYLSGGLEFFSSQFSMHVLKECKRFGLRVRAYTNGVSNAFDDHNFNKTLLTVADYIRFSIHGISAETYADVQMPHLPLENVRLEFERVLGHVANLVKIRKSSTDPCAGISICFLALGLNYTELDQAIQYWRNFGVDSLFIAKDMKEARKWFSRKEETNFRSKLKAILKQAHDHKYSPLAVVAARHAPRCSRSIQWSHKCFVAYKHPTVDPWGYVYTCNYRAHPSEQGKRFCLGKFPEDTLEHIIRKAHNDARIPLPFQCHQCPDWELAYNLCITDSMKFVHHYRLLDEPSRAG